MSHLAENRRGADQPRMVGRVRHVELPLLRGLPDQAGYCEHLAADGRRAFVSKQVLRDLAELERREAPVETAGLLFGGYFSDGRCSCTVVTKLVAPLPGEVHGTRSAVTITPAGAERMLSSAAREDPVLTPVGWAHTHPSFEAYFSETDRVEQRAWRNAGSVGLVLSGLSHARPRYRVFMGPESTAAERRSHAPAVQPSTVVEREPRPSDREIVAASAELAVDESAQPTGQRRRGRPVLRRGLHGARQARPQRRRTPSQRTAAGSRAKIVRQLRHDALRPVVVTRITAYVMVGALLLSLAISLYAVRVAHDAWLRAHQAPRPAAALSGQANTGAAPGVDAARVNLELLHVLSGSELRWVK
jgi:proteasome lid subunit RPN8/RPN11